MKTLTCHYYSEDFTASFGPGQPDWLTNFAYCRDGTVVANSNRAQSLQYSGFSGGKLAFLGTPHDNDGFDGYWAGRWVLNTNKYTPTATQPFGWEIIRELGWLNYHYQYNTAPISQVMAGIAFYADPDNLVNEEFGNDTSKNFQNEANYFDFMDFDGYTTAYYQRLVYFNAGDRNLNTYLEQAARPDGSLTNITNAVLIPYRGAFNLAAILTESFASTAVPSGWTLGGGAYYTNVNNLSGGAYSIEMPANAWVILPAVSNTCQLRFTARASNTINNFRVQTYLSTNSAPWQRLLATETYDSYTHSSGSSYANPGNYPIRWEGVWETNVRIMISNTSVNHGQLDNFYLYTSSERNTNKIGFRMTHNGSKVSMYVNPNPGGNNSIDHPDEWLLLKEEAVLWNRDVQCMIGHAHKYGYYNTVWSSTARYAYTLFDNMLVRSAASGAKHYFDLPDDKNSAGCRLALTAEKEENEAGINYIRIILPENSKWPYAPVRTIMINDHKLSVRAWNEEFPEDHEAAVIMVNSRELGIVLGKQWNCDQAQTLFTVFNRTLDLNLQKNTIVQVTAEQFNNMPAEKKGKYSTCGWQNSILIEPDLVAKAEYSKKVQ